MTPIKTRLGEARFGDYEHFGRRLFADLLGKLSYLGLVVYSISGRVLEKEDVTLLDDLSVAAHVPEPRVWPMKIPRLVAQSGRPLAGYVAGVAFLDGDVLGSAAVMLSARLLEEAKASGDLHAFVSGKERWPTIGVQQRALDERVMASRSVIERHAASTRPYWRLYEALWPIVEQTKGSRPTIFDALAPVLLDLGLSVAQIGALSAVLLEPQFLAQAFDGATNPTSSLRTLPDDAIAYVGPPARSSYRAR